MRVSESKLKCIGSPFARVQSINLYINAGVKYEYDESKK